MIQDPREKAADACCLKQARHSQVQSQPNKPCWEAHLSEVALCYLCTQDLQGLARRKKKRAVDDFLHCLLLLTFINVAHACMYAIFSFSFSESLHARAATWSHCGMLVKPVPMIIHHPAPEQTNVRISYNSSLRLLRFHAAARMHEIYKSIHVLHAC